MRKLLLIAGVATLAIPSLVLAQPDCRREQHDNRVAGTVVGAGAGALIGSAIAGPGSRGVGAVVGAVGGGALGNAAAGASTHCDEPSPAGYYDSDGAWHAAGGYYDANGRWIETAPAAGDVGADVAYVGGPDDLDSRASSVEARIHQGDASGALSRGDAEHDFDTLAGIRQFEARKRDEHDGTLGEKDRANVVNKLDNLSAEVRSQWRD